MTQEEIVKEKLEKEGQVTNLWALQHGIWRLGAVIHDLRQKGLDIETIYNTPEVKKNTHYKLKQKLTLF